MPDAPDNEVDEQLVEWQARCLAMTAYWFSRGMWGYRAKVVKQNGKYVIVSNLVPGGYPIP